MTYFDNSYLALLLSEWTPLQSLFSVVSFQHPLLFFSVSSSQTFIAAKSAPTKLTGPLAQMILRVSALESWPTWNHHPEDTADDPLEVHFTWLPGSSCPGIVLSHDFLLTFSPHIFSAHWNHWTNVSYLFTLEERLWYLGQITGGRGEVGQFILPPPPVQFPWGNSSPRLEATSTVRRFSAHSCPHSVSAIIFTLSPLYCKEKLIYALIGLTMLICPTL